MGCRRHLVDLYVPYVMHQYQTRPERIERAALIESQTLCEALTNCAALPKAIVLGCIPKKPGSNGSSPAPISEPDQRISCTSCGSIYTLACMILRPKRE